MTHPSSISPISEEDGNAIASKYSDGATIIELSIEYKRSVSTIFRCLRRLGIKTRGRGTYDRSKYRLGADNVYLPTEEEIREQTAAIRSTWGSWDTATEES